MKGFRNVCTDRANFHVHLNYLGKVSDPSAERYIPEKLRTRRNIVNSSARVFFYEVSQLSDPDPGRMENFLSDLQHFLHLRQPFEEMMWFEPGRKHKEEVLNYVNAMKVDICNDKYTY